MLSRHHLRQRILQGLYAYYQSNEASAAVTEKNILFGIERYYDLYLLLLDIFREFAHLEYLYRKDVQANFHTKKRTVSPNSLQSNLVIGKLSCSKTLSERMKKRGISWQEDFDFVKQIFYKLRTSAEYNEYLKSDNPEAKLQLDFILRLFKKFIQKNDFFVNHLEEKNIYWADSFPFCCEMVVKAFKSCLTNDEVVIQDLLRDPIEDREYIHKMVFETINNDTYWVSLITNRLKNWDMDRIAMMDVILMKMALTEIVYIETVPVKVSIDEYIELSKEYSTPKSNLFINGVIDKVVLDLRNQNKIAKTGRGLIE
ncbi:MAG: transcription antitermination protein NusB [Bacteroidia bacterium]|nr:transcription antitermination protein NusB [Bacteroidia bacterium]MCZ2277212.1 transcription antitermination protein NusB [Bacteroidia bacterium]